MRPTLALLLAVAVPGIERVNGCWQGAADLARFGRALMRPGLLSADSLRLLCTRPRFGTIESSMGFGRFVRKAGDGPRRIHITASNPGLQGAGR
jgi:CubicO group peptidase (beta-lactamase class C family)